MVKAEKVDLEHSRLHCYAMVDDVSSFVWMSSGDHGLKLNSNTTMVV